MELWWRIRGWTRLRLVSADCTGALRRISGEMKLADVSFPDELTAEFTVTAENAKSLLEKAGGELTVLSSGGFPDAARASWRWARRRPSC